MIFEILLLLVSFQLRLEVLGCNQCKIAAAQIGDDAVILGGVFLEFTVSTDEHPQPAEPERLAPDDRRLVVDPIILRAKLTYVYLKNKPV